MNGAQITAVVLDPSDDLADALGRTEDWLVFAEPDDPADATAVTHAARLAWDLNSQLQAAAQIAPDLYSPNGRVQLAPLRVLHADAEAAVGAMHGALLALSHEKPPSGTRRALDLLYRCAACTRSEDGAILAAAVRSGAGRVCLDARQYRAYQRFARLVLADPLDRLIALPAVPALG